MRRTIAWHSGSPKRTLNSRTRGPLSVIIKPTKSTPRNSISSRRSACTAGTSTRCSICRWMRLVSVGTGE